MNDATRVDTPLSGTGAGLFTVLLGRLACLIGHHDSRYSTFRENGIWGAGDECLRCHRFVLRSWNTGSADWP